MKCRLRAIVLIGVVAVLAGCQKKSDTSKFTSANPSDPAGATSPDVPSLGETSANRGLRSNVPKRKSLVGRWILVFFQPGSPNSLPAELPAALIEISPGAKNSKLDAKVKGFGIALGNPALKGIQATENSVRVLMEMAVQNAAAGQNQAPGRKTADIFLEFHDGVVRGSGQFGPAEPAFLVEMVPTEAENIQELRPQPLPEAHDLEMEGQPKDVKQEVVWAKLAAFYKAHPDSPATVELYPRFFESAWEQKVDEAKLNAEAEKYVAAASRWGARQRLRAHIEIANGLVRSNYQLPLALKQLDAALAQLDERTIPIWKATLEELKQAALTGQAVTEIHSSSRDVSTKAAELLRRHHKLDPYNPMVLHELARYDDERGSKDSALQEYAQLAVLPMLDELLKSVWEHKSEKHSSSRESAEKVWKEQHKGNTDGFEKYLDDVYAQSMPKNADKPVPPRSPDPENRAVLFELFTGTGCTYCVAADIAFAQLLKVYAPTEVIALQYHENIPHPDPMANTDTQERFKQLFPTRQATPTVFVSGRPSNPGGLLESVPGIYGYLRNEIDRALATKTTVKIRLTAEPKEGSVAVNAEAQGLFPSGEPIRMRLALAEERVHFRASNGIREHEMVVRAMPGGWRGVELKDDKLHYQGTVDLKAIRQQLDDYLKGLEEQNKVNFPTKPLDLSHLRLVAFVQNDQTGEVYQAAVIPFPSSGSPTSAGTQPSAPLQEAKNVSASRGLKASP